MKKGLKHNFKYKLMVGSFVVAGIVFAIFNVKKGAKDDLEALPTPTVNTIDDENSIDSATSYRMNTLANIYNITDKMNSINAVKVEDEQLMFTMEEMQSLYIYFNDLTKTDASNLFGEDEIIYDDVKKEFESALLKLRIYYAKSTNESSLSLLIEDEESRKLFSEFENKHLLYNGLDPEDRTDEAEDIIELFKKTFVDGSNLPYETANAGVSRAILTVFGTLDQMGWRNSTVKFPKDIRAILNDIETSLCARTNDYAKNLINDLETIQILQAQLNKDNVSEDDKNTYSALIEYYISKLISDSHYATSEQSFDANNPDIFINYNGKAKSNGDSKNSSNSSNNKGSNSKNNDKKSNDGGKKTGGKKTVIEAGTDWTPEDIPSKLEEFPEVEQEGLDQIEAIEDKLEEGNAEQKAYGDGLSDGYDSTYNSAWNAGNEGKAKPTTQSYSGSDEYQKGYAEGANKGIEMGYNDGVAARKAKEAKDAEIKASENTTSTTGTVPSTVPETPEIDINDEFEGEFDGPVYDKEGHIIGQINSIGDAINVLYAARDYISTYSNNATKESDGYSKSMC